MNLGLEAQPEVVQISLDVTSKEHAKLISQALGPKFEDEISWDELRLGGEMVWTTEVMIAMMKT